MPMDISRKQRLCISILLLSASFMTALSTSVTGNMLPPIQADLHIAPGAAQWLTSGAMMASGVLLPLTAAWIRRVSNRVYFLCAMGIFCAGSLIALFAPGFVLLVTGRVLQGAGCGMTLSFVQIILLALYPRDAHGRVLAGYAMSSTLASIIGPGYAGILTDRFGWRGVFFSLAVLAGVLFLSGLICLKNVTTSEQTHIRSRDTLLSAGGCFLLLLGVDRTDILCIAFGAGLLFLFCRTQLRTASPLLDFRVFSHPGFVQAVGMNLGIYLIGMGSSVLLPMLAQDLCGHSASSYGLAAIPGGMLSAAASFWAGRWFDRHGIGLPAVIGTAAYIGYGLLGLWFSPSWPLFLFGIAFTVQSVALGILNPVFSAQALSGLDPQARTDGSALYTALRQIISALAVTLSVSLYSRYGAVPVFVFYTVVSGLMALGTLAAFLRIWHKTPPS